MIAKPNRPRKTARHAAILAAQAQGCTCDVEAVTRGTHGPNAAYIELRHDDWCPLYRVMCERPPGPARTQITIHPGQATWAKDDDE